MAVMRLCKSIVVVAVILLPSVAISSGSLHGRHNLDASYYDPGCVVKTDVVVIGGGSVGTYAAIQIKDQGKKVVVIESKARLGGHTETYTDPESGQPIDMGVKLYYDNALVHEWYSRFNLSTSTIDVGSIGGNAHQFVDFRTGKVLQGVPAGNDTALAESLKRYSAVLQKYPQLENGFFLPEPVPEDLYMPFGKFVEKYDIAGAVQFFFNIAGAFGDILELPTLQQFRSQSLALLAATTSFQTSSVMNNSLLFGKATAELLKDKSLFLSSKVIATKRVSKSGFVKVLIDTPEGRRLVIAKKILITIPPTINSLASFDSNQEELGVFSKLKGFGYYTSIIRNAVPANVALQNLAPDKPYALPPMPAIYNVNPTGVNPSLSLVYYGTKLGQILSDEEAKSAIVADLKRYQKVNSLEPTEPEFVAFSNHSPYYLIASSEETKKGFYKNMYALQGKRNTFWSGATWRAQDSSASWAFTKNVVLPALVASL